MRAIWSGHIAFGLVSVPVKLYSAMEEHGPGLHQVHTCGSRIRHRRMCEREGIEVTQDEIARGWEAPDGRTVILSVRTWTTCRYPPARRRTCWASSWMTTSTRSCTPRRTTRHPTGPQPSGPTRYWWRPWARHGTVVVCKVTLRSRERLAVLRPTARHSRHTLRWPEEIRDRGDLASSAPVTDRELTLAEVLMDALAGVDLAELHDGYAAALQQLVAAKPRAGSWPSHRSRYRRWT
jgi:DNA end-binding protein Ku